MTKKMIKKEKKEFRKMMMERKEMIIRKLSEFINESKEVETNVAQDVVDKPRAPIQKNSS